MVKDLSGDQFAAIARSLSSELGADATFERATATALQIVEGCDYAGIALVEKRGDVSTLTATDDKVVRRLHELQVETGQGPDVDSIADQDSVYASDLRTDERWPEWTALVLTETDVRSVLSLRLFAGPGRQLGTMNLYSRSTDAFPIDERVSAHALAAHVAVAMNAAEGRQSMESALLNRTVIGQAEGMLMQKFNLSPDAAFFSLVRLSQRSQTKLHLVAADIVHHGIKPGLLD
ncbi:GAF and ANTAR domain-containing protein [Aeromicrobium sp. NPDC092404]|uniref:GAF and ANTAR domain-containing protein n=1 Tax=Aeromicrobium sp. NPDC092404 TaxID=3154976 RepID=UPI00341C13CD